MANGFKGEISLKYEGEDYTMVLDFNALCDFEGETGKNALTALDGMESGNVSASDLRALMWAGLRQNHPDMTLALAGSILSENADAIQRASEAANKPAGKRKAPAKKAPK
ncbi:GTA-gp10 family protein [Celeribacter sp.]|uniref:GTA-gp10 family protein n=1 Tax=Celeribacter sp. TaxID=1890673 RepID=UPI003A912587